MSENEVKNRNSCVYDIETLKSCFTYTAINIDTQEVIQYVIHKNKFQLRELVEHLKSCKGQIGFNNLNFDYPVIHYILCNYEYWLTMLDLYWTYQDVIDLIYNKAQELISSQNTPGFFPAIKDKFVKILQLDLFKIWHYDNKARMTSLKSLEISMNYPNVMDMPIHHSKEDITLEEVDDILKYNLNDVLATYEFYKKTIVLGKVDLRKDILNKYNIPCLNWNNGKIGENLILKLYCDKLKLNPWEIKKLRTYRKSINLAECIPDLIRFKSLEFNKTLDFFKNKTITTTKGAIDYSIIYKGIEYVFGTGGIHAAIRSGVFQSNDKYIIKSLDVASLYPNIPICFEFDIEHLGKDFLEVYRDEIVGVRLAEKAKPKELQDKSIVDGYKEAANIPYGKSNDENSFLYDPLYSMKTTITGQLVIVMLCERLSEIPDSQMLMVNTDGCEIKIPRQYEQLYNSICKEWEAETKLVLEFADYNKMWIRDINNYGCITTTGKIKNKGALEVDKVIGNEPAYHKDNSFRIVPLAVENYFVNNIPIEETIYNHKNIYDFCGRQKFGKDSHGEVHYINDSELIIEQQQKNVRYYIAKSGKVFIKQYSKGSSEIINKGYQVEIFNEYIEKDFSEYNIDYKFYIEEANKIINVIDSKQLQLF